MFITEEEKCFQKRLEESYDITTDSCYNMWKDKQLCVASSQIIGLISCTYTPKVIPQ